MYTDLPKLDMRIPSWKMKSLEARACPICAQHNRPAYRRPDGMLVAACTTCSTLYVTPAPSEQELSTFYCAYEHHSRDTSLIDVDMVLRAEPESDDIIQRVLCYTDLVGKRVLDVGCGRGTFMYMLSKLGAHVEGIDLCEANIEFAKSQFGLNAVAVRTLWEHNPSHLYDLITFNDVIEHVLEPRSFLARATSLLKPSGFIALRTPNGMIKNDVNVLALRVDLEHMQYFTTETCNFLANDLEIEIKHLECGGHPHLAGIDRLPSEVGKYVQGIRKRLRRIRLLHWMWTKARHLADHSEIGNYHLFCIFQKPATANRP
jgi:2-polyprenyl-3-methyl-5-hydroxy-6-metoxy-1,4-benzoquinol methylase